MGSGVRLKLSVQFRNIHPILLDSPEIGHGAARIKVGKNVDGSVLKLLGAERSGINDTAPDSNRTVESIFTLCDTKAFHQPAALQRRAAVEWITGIGTAAAEFLPLCANCRVRRYAADSEECWAGEQTGRCSSSQSWRSQLIAPTVP